MHMHGTARRRASAHTLRARSGACSGGCDIARYRVLSGTECPPILVGTLWTHGPPRGIGYGVCADIGGCAVDTHGRIRAYALAAPWRRGAHVGGHEACAGVGPGGHGCACSAAPSCGRAHALALTSADEVPAASAEVPAASADASVDTWSAEAVDREAPLRCTLGRHRCPPTLWWTLGRYRHRYPPTLRNEAPLRCGARVGVGSASVSADTLVGTWSVYIGVEHVLVLTRCRCPPTPRSTLVGATDRAHIGGYDIGGHQGAPGPGHPADLAGLCKDAEMRGGGDAGMRGCGDTDQSLNSNARRIILNSNLFRIYSWAGGPRRPMNRCGDAER